ncbi:cytochrome P450 family protein [Paludifilum halophilum]|uniref:cytochrome P450 family protein n=1 Tax=Paludifilum halophilum TaxID=1642702 RepID=UPI0023E4218C|nr:cytochrome P450 [Paludifilum halophilum]
MIQTLDFFSSEFKAEAYPVYAELRAKDPVYRITMPDGQTGWVITRYQDAVSALKDNRLVKNPRGLISSEDMVLSTMERDFITRHMLSSDPPDHTRLRSLVHKAFTPRMIEGLRQRIEQIVHGLLDEAEQRKRMDLIDDFAFPLPIIVICEMLGIPVQDRDRFREWSNAVIRATNHPERMQEAVPSIRAFIDYLRDLFDKRRGRPGDDLISALLHVESEGEQLTENELYSTVFLLIVAGHETTVNLIGNGVLALLEHPDQMDKLKNDPGLIRSTIEEMLRFYSPVEVATNRWAAEEVELHGKRIPKGDMVLVVLASANRDENRFDEPDRFDITRGANRHIAFGMGIHYCLGAPLARLEGEIAVNTLLQRMPDLRFGVDPKTLKWRPSYLMRGLIHLPVTW